MSFVFYDLQGRDGFRFSPYCWRIRLAMAHKGLAFEDVPVGFTEKDKIAFSGQKLVPVLVDKGRGDKVVFDSWEIANYLDDTYPDKPLFGSPEARGASRFINNWCGLVLNGGIVTLILADLFERVRPEDQAYFRETREKRFGKTLEQVQEGRDARLPAFRASLDPLRYLVRQQQFVGGDAPAFADYMMFGPFQWARLASDYELLAEDDPVAAWRTRMLDLYDGLGRKAIYGNK